MEVRGLYTNARTTLKTDVFLPRRYATVSLCSMWAFVCFLLGNSPASELYIYADVSKHTVPSSYLPAYEDGTDRVFRNVGIYTIQSPGNYPEERIQRSERDESFEIKNAVIY